ncbi:hypothetical protein I5E68_07205 [Novosphingobium sp. YJ-S2-02]|uniref:Uncharacterized protein n=1 Tax=Novosphingobium aureum TaxID=2792964 RepID=A0A931HC26_9SPHN|nr:hypothetical protein [Novosphingobium aureum]MBH0112738.1 hypothetical protein [Novosphingobium aureum]
MTARDRKLIEDAIEALIALLDHVDGDADAEIEEDEPENDSEPPLAVPLFSDVGYLSEVA